MISFAEDWAERNKTEQELENFLLNDICTLTGAYKAICQSLVENNLQEIIQYVFQKESPQVVCEQLHACTNSTQTRLGDNNLDCQTCQLLVDLSDSILGPDASSQAIKNFLDNIACGILPTTYRTPCKTIESTYFNQLSSAIQKGENGSYACSQFQFCQQNNKMKQKILAPKQKSFLPASQHPLLKKIKSQLKDSSEECTICITIINLVEYVLGSNKTQSDVEKFLDGICIVFGKDRDLCESVVDNIIVNGIDYILQNENSTYICTSIGVCNNQKFNLLPHGNNFVFPPKKNKTPTALLKKENPKCEPCLDMISNLIQQLGNNPSQVIVENAITGICKPLSPVEAGQCEDTMHAYTMQIIQWIKQGVTESDICLRIKYC